MNTNFLRLIPAMILASTGAAIACDKAAPPAPAAASGGPEPTMIRVLGEESQAEHTWSDGKTEVRLINKDGKVRVFVNGSEVMTLNDDDVFGLSTGEEAKVHADRAREMAREIRERMRQGMAPVAPMAPLPPAERPRVMMGVTMESAAETGIELPEGTAPENATVITRVVKGLPAEAAGLKEGDVVVRINGIAGASPDAIREAVKSKNEGDSLRLGVLRDGKEQEIVINLAPYDAEKLGSPRAWTGTWSGQGFGGTSPPPSAEDVKRLAELRAKMEKTSAEMEKIGAELAAATTDAQREELGARLAELGAQLADVGQQMGEASGGRRSYWRWLSQEGDQLRMERLPRMRIERDAPGAPPRAFVFGNGSGQGQGGGDDRIDELNKRLDRLEEMLQKVLAEKQKP